MDFVFSQRLPTVSPQVKYKVFHFAFRYDFNFTWFYTVQPQAKVRDGHYLSAVGQKLRFMEFNALTKNWI